MKDNHPSRAGVLPAIVLWNLYFNFSNAFLAEAVFNSFAISSFLLSKTPQFSLKLKSKFFGI